MSIPLHRPAALNARLEAPIEEWPYLDKSALQKSRSRKVCMSVHWFRHHAGVNCIPALTCQLHEGGQSFPASDGGEGEQAPGT